MKIQLAFGDHQYQADLSKPLDISLTIGGPRCFYAPDVKVEPYTNGDFVGSVKAGAPVNFFNVHFNPHGNGTHTECFGHITKQQHSVNQYLKDYHHCALLISVALAKKGKSDKVITASELKTELKKQKFAQQPKALIIRTKPNRSSKAKKDYSGTNPPYLDKRAMQLLVDLGVEHLLIDLPSVDREVDKGLLAGHHIFWQLEKGKKINTKRKSCTITEMVYVSNEIKDGLYLLNLQVAPFELDASPSRPVLFRLIKN